jgi:uncharacterized protein
VLITLQELEIRPVTVSKSYAPGELDYHGAEFRQAAPLQVRAVAKLNGQEIRVKGHLETRLSAMCDRCLTPIEIGVQRDFDLRYLPLSSIAREEEVEISRDELELGFYRGEGIELADLVTEQVILSVPMKKICGQECKGLCPVCGANLNLEECHSHETPVDSPFAALKQSAP